MPSSNLAVLAGMELVMQNASCQSAQWLQDKTTFWTAGLHTSGIPFPHHPTPPACKSQPFPIHTNMFISKKCLWQVPEPVPVPARISIAVADRSPGQVCHVLLCLHNTECSSCAHVWKLLTGVFTWASLRWYGLPKYLSLHGTALLLEGSWFWNLLPL